MQRVVSDDTKFRGAVFSRLSSSRRVDLLQPFEASGTTHQMMTASHSRTTESSAKIIQGLSKRFERLNLIYFTY